MKPLLSLFDRLTGFPLATLLLTQIFMAKAASTLIPLTVDENLITFFPPVQLQSGVNCQGVRIARQLIATSKPCAQVINKQTVESITQILDGEEITVGNITAVKGDIPLSLTEQDMIFYLSGAVDAESDIYPGIRSLSTTPAITYAYFRNDDNEIIKEPVTAVQLKAFHGHPSFDVSSETELPSGAIVMDDQNHLVCLMSLKNQCLGLIPEHSILTRKLEQSPGESAEASLILPVMTEVAIVLGLMAGAAATFYLTTFIRSRHLGISSGVFWKNMCNFGYCSGWSSLSSVLCGLGTLCFIPTFGYSGASCWAAFLAAAWKWMDNTRVYSPDDPENPLQGTIGSQDDIPVTTETPYDSLSI